MQILSYPISALNVRESPKFSRLVGNLGLETRRWRQILGRKWKQAVSRMRNKNVQYNPYLCPNWWKFRVLKKLGVEDYDGNVSGSGNMAVSCMRNASDHTGVTRVGVTLYFLKTDDLF